MRDSNCSSFTLKSVCNKWSPKEVVALCKKWSMMKVLLLLVVNHTFLVNSEPQIMECNCSLQPKLLMRLLAGNHKRYLLVCSRLSGSREDAKVKGMRKVGGGGKRNAFSIRQTSKPGTG